MPRRSANVNQADVMRILRACKREEVPVRIVLQPNGCAVFETVATSAHDDTATLDRELADFEQKHGSHSA
jgi:hypothetical protein